MTNSSIPPPSLEQEYTDSAIAHSERRSAQLHCFQVTTQARARDPTNYKQDVSVVLAEIELQAAESRLVRIVEYYRELDLSNTLQSSTTATTTTARTAANLNSTPINTGIVIEIEDSDDEEDQGSDPFAGPPGYTSWPPTPTHFYAALLEDNQAQSPSVPSTPTRRRRDEGEGILCSQYLNAPPSSQPRQPTPATPATPRHVTSDTATIVGEGGVLTSPAPKKKHYIVTRGRRIGIYATWAETKAYTDGLSGAAWQGFKTYSEALDAYMRARDRGLLRVERLPEDSEADFGPCDEAEDL